MRLGKKHTISVSFTCYEIISEDEHNKKSSDILVTVNDSEAIGIVHRCSMDEFDMPDEYYACEDLAETLSKYIKDKAEDIYDKLFKELFEKHLVDLD